ncbi:hypothetical protein PPMP20_18390 [Paraburkholderia phymatum]|nr:hypothetical protein [Paraburkholderia phymatum]
MTDAMKAGGAGFRRQKLRFKPEREQGVAGGVSSQQKIARLRERTAWPDRTCRVEVIETHLSWVFLTARHAWKLKKPRRSDAIDLRSIAARKRNGEMELRLNRRLSPSVYLGVVPLTVCGYGAMRVGGSGKVVDWLLKMRRLPAGLMLDCALARGAVHKSDTARIVRKLSAFYRTLPGSSLSGSAYRARFLSEIARNESVLARIMSRRSAEVRQLCDIQRALLAGLTDRLESRVAHGWIRECHGDLRPEHVCLTRPVAIIDCLEFSERLRTIDTLDEVGFLALECERLGALTVGNALLAAYGASMHDPVDKRLLHFYQSMRATVRARLAAAHLLEPGIKRVRRWRKRALAYLELGSAHARQCADAFQMGMQAPMPDTFSKE